MSNLKTPRQAALDAITYVRGLEAVFARCSNGAYGAKEDYAISKEPKSEGDHQAAVSGWISTPSVPNYVATLLSDAAKHVSEEEVTPFVASLKEVHRILTRIADSERPHPNYTTSAGNIIDSAADALPEIKRQIAQFPAYEAV
jgi:hypothetical protein